jgi:hypothetical protein
VTTKEKDELNTIRSNITNDSRSGNIASDNDNLEHEAWEMDVDSILAGGETMDISHTGGEFASIIEITDDLLGTSNR